MTKEGYTHIIVSEELHRIVKREARIRRIRPFMVDCSGREG